jgi:hypothetical protein
VSLSAPESLRSFDQQRRATLSRVPARRGAIVTERTEEHLTPLQAAACLMAVLERRGATFELNAAGQLRFNLDGAVATSDEADDLARCVLALRAEIKQLLHDERTVH